MILTEGGQKFSLQVNHSMLFVNRAECISTRSVITRSRIHCVKVNMDYGSSFACVRAINKVHKI